MKKPPVIGTCALCRTENVPLEDSHVIPKFVFLWAHKASVTGHFRFLHRSSIRTERGLTLDLLCHECEQLFGKLETIFALKIFHPLLEKPSTFSIPYDGWLLRFCVSVAWRALLVEMAFEANSDNKRDESFLTAMQITENAWRDFLLDDQARGQGMTFHLLPLNSTGLKPADFAERMETYINFSIDFDAALDYEPLVYVKIGPVLIVGFIQQIDKSMWQGGLIDAVGGTVSSGPYSVPTHFKNELIKRADTIDQIFAQLSKDQKAKTEKAKQKNLVAFNASELAEALKKDSDELQRKQDKQS